MPYDRCIFLNILQVWINTHWKTSSVYKDNIDSLLQQLLHMQTHCTEKKTNQIH